MSKFEGSHHCRSPQINDVKIPCEDVDVQPFTADQQGVQELAQLIREPVRLPINQHPYASIKIPTENNNRSLGLNGRFPKGTEIGLAVHEKCRALRRFDPPTIAARLEERPAYR